MQIYYILAFKLEGVEESELYSVKHSLLSGLVLGGVTKEFFYQLPTAVSFISTYSPEVISSILDKINNQVFAGGKVLRYFLSEINPDTIKVNVNEKEELLFREAMSK